mgnify:CR=1 FL=1
MTVNSGEVSRPCGSSPPTKLLTRPAPSNPLTGCWFGSVPFAGPVPNASPSATHGSQVGPSKSPSMIAGRGAAATGGSTSTPSWTTTPRPRWVATVVRRAPAVGCLGPLFSPTAFSSQPASSTTTGSSAVFSTSNSKTVAGRLLSFSRSGIHGVNAVSSTRTGRPQSK